MKTWILILNSLLALNAAAQENSHVREPSSFKPKTLTDEAKGEDTRDPLPDAVLPTMDLGEGSFVPGWTDVKKKMSERGYEFGLIYKGEINSVFKGGVQPHSQYLENLDVRLNLNLEKIAGLKGGSIFLYGLGNRGATDTQSTSLNVGDIQGTSNIQTSSSQFILYEAWYQHLFFDEKVSILAGLHDLNSEFYTVDSASVFLNSSFGIGKEISQTGENGPSIFPATSPSLRVKAEPSENVYLQTAVFNAHAGDIRAFGNDGNLLISEAGILNIGSSESKYAVGIWTYDRTFTHQENPDEEVVSEGYYVMADFHFGNHAVFVKYGQASTASNAVGAGLVAGVQFKNLFADSWHDRLGLGIAKSYLGSEFIRTQESGGASMTDSETTFELTYRFEIAPGIALQPDFQYVINPSGRTDVDNAQVGALRVEIAL